MSVEIKDAGDARKVALVTFESDEVTSQESQVCKQFGRMANIPGFRKGKAPERRDSEEILQRAQGGIEQESFDYCL